MKKLMLVLAVMLIAAPAFASVANTVSITATPDGCGAAINYTSTGTLPRAFALDITVDGGAVITGVDVAGAQPFNIYMGTIQIDATGVVTSAGTPVAPATATGALGGIGTSGVTIEMGSLYDKSVTPNAAKPAASGLLIKVTVDKSCILTMASNTVRGNVVLEDATVVAPTLTGTAIVCGPTCNACALDITGDGWIGPEDIGELIVRMNNYADNYYYISPGDPDYNECWDLNGDAYIGPEDLGELIVMLNGHEADYYYADCTDLGVQSWYASLHP